MRTSGETQSNGVTKKEKIIAASILVVLALLSRITVTPGVFLRNTKEKFDPWRIAIYFTWRIYCNYFIWRIFATCGRICNKEKLLVLITGRYYSLITLCYTLVDFVTKAKSLDRIYQALLGYTSRFLVDGPWFVSAPALP